MEEFEKYNYKSDYEKKLVKEILAHKSRPEGIPRLNEQINLLYQMKLDKIQKVRELNCDKVKSSQCEELYLEIKAIQEFQMELEVEHQDIRKHQRDLEEKEEEYEDEADI